MTDRKEYVGKLVSTLWRNNVYLLEGSLISHPDEEGVVTYSQWEKQELSMKYSLGEATYLGEEEDHLTSPELALVPMEEEEKPSLCDAVNHPSHYQFFEDVEAIQIIARSLTREQFKGYCMGNKLKYRLRAGEKDNLQQDIDKSNKYSELWEKYKDGV